MGVIPSTRQRNVLPHGRIVMASGGEREEDEDHAAKRDHEQRLEH
jgi:hypothetical protein